jgi:hypothetical protein
LTIQTCPAQRQAFFGFVFFVATKKRKLLSGNPDDFDFDFEFNNSSKEDNRLTIYCPLYHEVWLNFVSSLRAAGKQTSFL